MLKASGITSLQFNPSVTEIPYEMFAGSSLATVNLPSGLKTIGEKAFCNCQLESIEFNEGLLSIGAEAFNLCSALTNITMSSTIESVGDGAFDCTQWFNNAPAEDYIVYIGKVAYSYKINWDDEVSTITIKDGTVAITDFLLDGLYYLKKIVLPQSLRVIGSDSFRNLQQITSVNIPEGLERIGDEAFSGCYQLRSITIPKGVKYLGDRAFEKCYNLIRVNYNAVDANAGIEVEPFNDDCGVVRAVIGEGVRSLPYRLFYNCRNLARVEMASTVERIGKCAFYETSLDRIDLPTGLKEIGINAFHCSTMKKVNAYMKEPYDIATDIWYYSEGTLWNVVDYCFGNMSRYGVYSPAGLLQVGRDVLSAYQQNNTWSVQFEEISTFDRASDMTTVEGDVTVDAGKDLTDDTDMSGTIVNGVYYALDVDNSDDGFNSEEGCVIINSTVTDEQMDVASQKDVDDLTLRNNFNGLIFEVPAGNGSIIIDCQTLGQNAVNVKIGDDEPQQVTTNERQQITVTYDVSEPTRVFVYGAEAKSTRSKAAAKNAPTRAPETNEDAVKFYGMKIQMNSNGVENVTADNSATQRGIFNLQGMRMNNCENLAPGIYILDGKKVVIK